MVDLGGDGSLATRTVELFLVVTLLGIVPGIVMMATCFPFLVTVFSILRQAVGLQQAPPNMLMISLALFLTYFVMEPVALQAWSAGIEPWTQGKLSLEAAFPAAIEPFRVFMLGRVDPETLGHMASLRSDLSGEISVSKMPISVIIPSFMISEISHAFEVGFLLYLPFLIIDLLVSAILMSMGMMMVPPAVVSLPFKLAFFVMVNGWALLAEGLVKGYA